MGGRDSRAIRSQGAAADGPARTQTWHGSSMFTQVAVLTRRAVLDYLTDPRGVVLGLLQPIVILYLVANTFGKFGSRLPGFPAGISYFQFVLPAVLVDNAIQTSLQTGAGLIDELRNGFVARLRSLPILPSSILIARSNTGLVRTAVQAFILLVLAQLTHGNFSRGGLAGMAVSVGLTMLIGWGLGWMFLMAGTRVRRSETMQNLGFVVVLPLMFASSAYVPVTDLPTPLAVVARINPVTYAINAERAIFLQTAGGPVGARAILPSVLISLVLGTATAYAAVRLFRRPLQVVQQ